MSTNDGPKPGTISWTDLTVENAEEVRDFYQEVVGWDAHPVDMGQYTDFGMAAPGPMAGGRFCVIGDPAGAVCALYRPPDSA